MKIPERHFLWKHRKIGALGIQVNEGEAEGLRANSDDGARRNQ